MTRSTTTISLQALFEQSTASAEEKAALDTRLKNLELDPLEKFLLVSLHTPTAATLAADIEIYEGWIQLISNGENDEKETWKDEDELPKEFTKELLEDADFIGKVLASLYQWYKKDFWNYEGVVAAFANKLGDYSDGNFLFMELAPEWKLFYNRVTALIFVEYFEHLPQSFEIVFINAHLVVIAAQLELGIDKAIAADVDRMVLIDSRQELNTEYAAFLATNKTVLGSTATGEDATVASWIAMFNEKFPHGDPVKNVADFMAQDLFGNCSVDEKAIIGRLVGLYGKLASGQFVLLPEDIEAAKKLRAERDQQKAAAPAAPVAPTTEQPTVEEPATKPEQVAPAESEPAAADVTPPASYRPKRPSFAEIKTQMEKEFERDAEGKFVRPDLVINRLMEVAIENQNKKIGELFFFDENSGEFTWNTSLIK